MVTHQQQQQQARMKLEGEGIEETEMNALDRARMRG
jgi:hypothetical protein